LAKAAGADAVSLDDPPVWELSFEASSVVLCEAAAFATAWAASAWIAVELAAFASVAAGVVEVVDAFPVD
jgi:hypothetical protein